MENFIKKYKLGLIGIVLGGILGYAYYHFIGAIPELVPLRLNLSTVRFMVW